MREKDHVADGGRAGQQHDEAVDTDAFAGGRRHAVFEGADVVGVVVHGFVVAGIFGSGLRPEAFGLVFGIIELGKAVGDFATADVELEAVADVGVFIVASR